MVQNKTDLQLLPVSVSLNEENYLVYKNLPKKLESYMITQDEEAICEKLRECLTIVVAMHAVSRGDQKALQLFERKIEGNEEAEEFNSIVESILSK